MSNTTNPFYKNDFKPIKNNEPQNQSLRIHCVSVRFNQAELENLNINRRDKSKGEWLRLTSLEKLPVIVPEINIESWKLLSDISQKLNRIINHLDTKSSNSELTKTEIFAVKRQINELRSCLIVSELSVK
ncbi:hypothetical protein H0I69_17650 [Yersinia enterocolitica]|uniref:hypothetical protein n=1 Tax=Yersinia enterocolitica TaxID=630 RepID=UPI001CA5B389|nr:hypothetical protein [Yersinia enterocolitica]MBW5869619.1 hypothetical protein [Yersinia enterocolitica]